jgi:hypothetical protein
MHLTLKKEATKPASGNFLQQQARFDKFLEVFNNERPHEALGMKCQAEIYQPSTPLPGATAEPGRHSGRQDRARRFRPCWTDNDGLLNLQLSA